MAYVHNLSPFALQFTETFGIRWYGLAYLSGFITGYYTLVMLAKRGGTQVKQVDMADLTTYVAIGVLVGGRLGYALFYSQDLFTSFDGHFPYWGVLKVNEGGMASHGGILGVMLVCYLFARAKKIPFFHILDLTTLGAAVGFWFGRIANFINGELYGREAPPGLAWAVKFPQELLLWVQKDFPRLRTVGPAVDALHDLKLGNGDAMPVNSNLWQTWLQNYNHDFTSRQYVHETIDALIKAVQLKNQAVTAALAEILTARHPSQLYQSFMEGFLVFVVLIVIWRRPQKPGVIAGWFGFLYSFARIVGEQFRMPDVQIGYQLFGLTRGQWLSIGFLLASVVWLIFCYKRNTPKLGGWGKKSA